MSNKDYVCGEDFCEECGHCLHCEPYDDGCACDLYRKAAELKDVKKLLKLAYPIVAFYSLELKQKGIEWKYPETRELVWNIEKVLGVSEEE